MGIRCESIFLETTNNMKLALIILAVLPCIKALDLAPEKVKDASREGKVFSLFSVVTFPNAGCTSQSGTTGISGVNRNGTCYTATECSDNGGTASGNCAAGFGVCCLFVYSSASTTISQNCSYIQNPNFPSAYASTSTIAWQINKCATNICTMRLDFETFTTTGPTVTNDATTATLMDSFVVTSSPSGFTAPTIAGENKGQHIYVEVGPDSGAYITMTFTFGTSTTISRYWEIHVTQHECSSTARPYDSGCLQYHTGSAGRLESFNFAQSTSSLYGHLHSQDYNICIRQEQGACCIKYSLCDDTYSYAIQNVALIASGAYSGSYCSLDFIEITGLTKNCGSTASGTVNRVCGHAFNVEHGNTVIASTLCDCTAPFQLQFVTNGIAQDTKATGTDQPQRGFCFQYQQVACAGGTA